MKISRKNLNDLVNRLTRLELLELCKSQGIKGLTKKKKEFIVTHLYNFILSRLGDGAEILTLLIDINREKLFKIGKLTIKNKEQTFPSVPNDIWILNLFEDSDPEGVEWVNEYIDLFFGSWIIETTFELDPESKKIKLKEPEIFWRETAKINQIKYYTKWKKEIIVDKGVYGKKIVVYDNGEKYMIFDDESDALTKIKELKIDFYFTATVGGENSIIL